MNGRDTSLAPVGRSPVAAFLGALVFSSRFVTIWIATGVLLIVAQVAAPRTLSGDSWSAMLPLATVVAIAATGQMLVVMTGGIDLSMAGAISLLANVLVGASSGQNSRLALSLLVVLGWAIAIGLVNGTLIGMLGLNPLIVTLATGLVLLGVTEQYRFGTANEASVPPAVATFVFTRFLGVSWVFWIGLLITIGVALLLRSTRAGRRFQAVGANPRAAWMAGIRVRTNVVVAYVASAVAAGVAGVLIAGVVVSPGLDPGAPYLLGPIAAVVLAGASLSGGLASVTSTWVAAIALTVLNQLLRVLRLSTAFQFMVFGVAIVLGMVISGDRIAAVVGRVLQRPRVQLLLGAENRELADEPR